MAAGAGGGAEARVRKRRAVSIATINGDGSDRYAVGRREAVRGGCGKNFLFFTAPRHTYPIPLHPTATRWTVDSILRKRPHDADSPKECPASGQHRGISASSLIDPPDPCAPWKGRGVDL
jgi:hypothetical protein